MARFHPTVGFPARKIVKRPYGFSSYGVCKYGDQGCPALKRPETKSEFVFDFEKYWEKSGIHTDQVKINRVFKEYAKKAVDAAMLEMGSLFPVTNPEGTILKAFSKEGKEIPFAIENGDFTFRVPVGYTLVKEGANHEK